MLAAAVVLLGTLAVGDRCAVGRTGQFVSVLEQIGNPVVRDPLNRGTWIADEERDEISFVDNARNVISTQACAWPERIVVGQDGRAFANCRASGSEVVMGLDGFGAEVPV